MPNFHCKQCGSCCMMIPGLFEVSKQGDLLRLYQYVRENLQGFLWGKIQVKTFSEFLYYVRDFSSASEQLRKEDPGCPFLVQNYSSAECIVHSQKPTGCKIFPGTRNKAYELTLDCRGWK
ncbi:MAG: YkgJ family cysteine cluster protein [Candidatus Hodarchaeota archaeon]